MQTLFSWYRSFVGKAFQCDITVSVSGCKQKRRTRTSRRVAPNVKHGARSSFFSSSAVQLCACAGPESSRINFNAPRATWYLIKASYRISVAKLTASGSLLSIWINMKFNCFNPKFWHHCSERRAASSALYHACISTGAACLLFYYSILHKGYFSQRDREVSINVRIIESLPAKRAYLHFDMSSSVHTCQCILWLLL